MSLSAGAADVVVKWECEKRQSLVAVKRQNTWLMGGRRLMKRVMTFEGMVENVHLALRI